VNNSGRPISYRTAIVLGIVALILNFAGYNQSLRSEILKARRIEQAFRAHVRYVEDAETARLILAGNILSIAGLTLTFAGFTSMAIAIVRSEKGWYLILFCLLIVSVLPLLFA
jgi:hypothetical protein